MGEEVLDDINSKKRKYSFAQKAYWLLLISLFLWVLTSLAIGVTGHLPWIWSVERFIALLISFLILVLSFLGIRKALISRKIKEPKSKEQRLGLVGNIFVFLLFLLMNFNNVMELYIYGF